MPTPSSEWRLSSARDEDDGVDGNDDNDESFHDCDENDTRGMEGRGLEMEEEDEGGMRDDDVESHDDGDGQAGTVDDEYDDETDDESRNRSDGIGDTGIGHVVPVGALVERLDPDSGLCWSCLVRLRPPNNDEECRHPPPSSSHAPSRGASSFLYSTHTHPLLDIAVCSVCEERASAVESNVVDVELGGDGIEYVDEEDGSVTLTSKTTNACSWCGLLDDELGYNDIYDDIPLSDLVLCDACPRGFCVRCVTLSHGGDVKAWEEVRRHVVTKSSSGSAGDDDDDDDDEAVDAEWKCPHCRPTSFLSELRDAHARASSRGGEATVNDDGDGGGMTCDRKAQEDDETRIDHLLKELDYAEDAMKEATRHLDEARVERERNTIESEIVNGRTILSKEDLEREVRAELDMYRRGWQTHVDRLQDTIVELQEELDSIDRGVYEQYYRYRLELDGVRSSADVVGGSSRDRMALDEYKKSADLALARRDETEGFSRGEFRGASGYKPKDPRVLKLEPEDLNEQCLNEIEDVNTLEGAISQMQSNAKERNSFRSKTGTTELDFEMLRNKAIKFEKISLGDLIDLDLLERRSITDKDDAMAMKMEDAMEVCRTGSTRVVTRIAPLRALKAQARKECTESRLPRDTLEYKPRLPRQNNDVPATLPKAKKRAELQRLSTGLGSSAAESGRLSPTMMGLLIGDDTAEFMDSDFILKVENCTSKVTVCRPLAMLLKEHQKDGLKFCWKNVCSKIMSPKEKDNDEIHGAILAHNMGLGKSFQAVCLLHTLLTHPALITTSGRRVIRTALLIAPVNTLANWETEFQKWVGASSGRSIPGIRFYSWKETRSKLKLVKEWYSSGGIICVSTEKYAMACKDYLDVDKRNSNSKKANSKKSTTTIEDDAFLRKALFGPDIVVLDEVHTMLKSNSTIIYKVLGGLHTKLRLGLTGSPIQNNLYEYYRMASWVSPGCLGTEAHFTKTFRDPIMDGMAADCSPLQAEKQEQVSGKMHSILSKFVHRRDADVLARDLPFLQETIIHVRQSKVQMKLYKEFRKHQSESTDTKNFFRQYHALRPISNHPAVKIIFEDKSKESRHDTPLTVESIEDDSCVKVGAQNQPRVAPSKYAWICDKCQRARFRTFEEAEAHEEICDGNYNADTNPELDDYDEIKIPTKEGDPENDDWWTSFAERAEKSDLNIKAIDHGGKIVLLLQIIAHCDLIGDKVVVFSQSLPTLSYIEEILNSPDWGGFKLFLPDDFRKQNLGGWRRNQEYLRIDGSVDAKERGDLIDTFHSDTAAGNQSKLFLLSTNAGGLGINLIAANRVVLFDSHWNPAVDLQAVYRCYRYGQTKPTFCYRLLAEGSMEQKIYSRAAAKTSLSELVIDQTNPERSFTKHEMDLLRIEDNWVGCNACNKWRMLPPDISSEEIQNLPDEWYCKDNIYDPARSTCAAEERDGVWMVSFYERRAKKEDDAYVQSQGSLTNSEKVTAYVRPAFDRRHQEYTERDIVLRTLIDRSEDKTANNTSGNASSAKKTWVSKWDFNFEKSEKLDSDMQEQEQQIEKNSTTMTKRLKSPAKVKLFKSSEKRNSPQKTDRTRSEASKQRSPHKPINQLKSPVKKIKLFKSPENRQSPHKTNKARSEPNKPRSPYEQLHKSPQGGKKWHSFHKSIDTAERNNKPRSPNKEVRHSQLKWQRKARRDEVVQSLSDGGADYSNKKRKLEKSAEKDEAKMEEGGEDGVPKPSIAKEKEKNDDADVVDLTFSDTD